MNKQQIGVAITLFLCATIAASGKVPAHVGAKKESTVSVAPEVSTRNIPRLTPAQQALEQEKSQLVGDALAAQKAGRYAEAVDDASQALELGQDSGLAQEILAYSLNAQGKSQEALEAYKKIVEMNGRSARLYDLIPYAQLLLHSGQWAQAVAVYNQAWPTANTNDSLPPLPGPFSADVPQPKELETVLHIARGLAGSGWGSPAPREEAMTQFSAALKLMPDNPLVSYYYGRGWQQLSPAEQKAAKPGQREAVKAALEKAATLGTPDVSAAAKAELKSLR